MLNFVEIVDGGEVVNFWRHADTSVRIVGNLRTSTRFTSASSDSPNAASRRAWISRDGVTPPVSISRQ